MILANKLLIICGPTATGKTALAIQLAKRSNGELVSADARQIYQELDALSGKDIPLRAKPRRRFTVDWKGKTFPLVTYKISDISVWLYDVAPLDQPLSVAHYQTLALEAIGDIQRRGKLPIVVGGTGLYLSSLIQPMETIHIPPDWDLREALKTWAVADLQQELKRHDMGRWQQMNQSDRGNPRRLIRVIEVASWRKSHNSGKYYGQPKYASLMIGLRAPLEVLRVRIKERVARRWRLAVREVKKLRFDANLSLPSATALGIVPIKEYLAGNISETEAKLRWMRDELSYAKRQMTWFKKQCRIYWFGIVRNDMLDKVEKLVDRWYTGGKVYAR